MLLNYKKLFEDPNSIFKVSKSIVKKRQSNKKKNKEVKEFKNVDTSDLEYNIDIFKNKVFEVCTSIENLIILINEANEINNFGNEDNSDIYIKKNLNPFISLIFYSRLQIRSINTFFNGKIKKNLNKLNQVQQEDIYLYLNILYETINSLYETDNLDFLNDSLNITKDFIDKSLKNPIIKLLDNVKTSTNAQHEFKIIGAGRYDPILINKSYHNIDKKYLL
jgi:hypothetical protein